MLLRLVVGTVGCVMILAAQGGVVGGSLGGITMGVPGNGRPAAAPPPVNPEEAGSIAGTVVSAATGEPLRAVEIRAMGMLRALPQSGAAMPSPSPTYTAQTDASGKFVLQGLPPGSYTVMATRRGYAPARYGAETSRSAGTPVELSARQSLTIDMKMQASAVVSGQVLDELGEPMMRARVEALRPFPSGPTTRRMPAGNATTDDRGYYRIFDLEPGKYQIRASSTDSLALRLPGPQGEAPAEMYLPVYYPSGFDAAGASWVEVAAGGEVSGINLNMAKGRVYSLRARVVAPPDAKEGVIGMVTPAGGSDDLLGSSRRMVRANAEGIVDAAGLTPGKYVVRLGANVGSTTYTGSALVDVVNENIDGLQILLKPNFALSGRVVAEDGAQVDFSRLRVSLQTEHNQPMNIGINGVRVQFGVQGTATVAADGTFALGNLSDDRAWLHVMPIPAGFYVKSVRLGNRETIDSGMDLTEGAGEIQILLGNKPASVTGTVTVSGGEPAPGAQLVLIPDAEALQARPQTYIQARTDQTGSFTIGGVRPGKYHLYAWETIEAGQWMDPDLLRSRQSSVAVTAEENGQHQVTVKAIPPSR